MYFFCFKIDEIAGWENGKFLGKIGLGIYTAYEICSLVILVPLNVGSFHFGSEKILR